MPASSITVRLLYTSDVGVQWAGWFADDFLLADDATVLFSDDVESGTGWTTNHFVIVPLTRIYPMYYMAEWRNDSGFDRGLKYPYQTVYNNDATNEWEVDRCAHTVPGMLLWLRNGAYDFDYVLSDSFYDPPSLGPSTPCWWWTVTTGRWPGVTTRTRAAQTCVSPHAASRPMPPSRCRTPRPSPSAWATTRPLASTWMSRWRPRPSSPSRRFRNSTTRWATIPACGIRPATGGLYFWQAEASAVVPATDNYTTKITWLDKSPLTDLYGADLGWTVLGSGDPRDDGVQYGVNIAVLDKAKDGTWGKIAVWNATSLAGLEMKVNLANAFPGQILMYHLKVRNLSPAPQPFTVSDLIPANTTYLRGDYYNAATNSIEWTGTIGPNETMVSQFFVTVNMGTQPGTVIMNEAFLSDDALGSSASATTIVKKK